ncbi:chemotaxis protein CheW [Bacterioplanes sanyensis]|uniref:Chemotaxis protein CheW n=1 Tax=Bacterioplanes sanyensis TaxID=1249553 RepID=A0A222FLR9_9GAMM|nr:chemotaxis protein CheW [Bacterioplanes sanyensis]ASP39331.1 chemotaxis protein CheW [Bacterioplanes sanyensis]
MEMLEQTPALTNQYLTFMVHGKRYAISILEVKEIIEVSSMTRVPMAADAIRGVINLRGNVAPVIDLNQRLKNTATKIGRRSVILVVERHDQQDREIFGMLVDSVSEIVEIDLHDIQDAPDFGVGIRQEFIERMARINGSFVVMLHLGRILDAEELSQREAS